MPSFRGSFRHSIDGKNRLALPKPFRRLTGTKTEDDSPFLVLTRGFNGCVAAYSEEDWPAYEDQLRENAFTEQGPRDFLLDLANQTADAPIDTVGRILIPQRHLEMGGFEKNQEILVLGMFDHIELWNIERYEAHLAGSKASFEDKAKEFFQRKSSG